MPNNIYGEKMTPLSYFQYMNIVDRYGGYIEITAFVLTPMKTRIINAKTFVKFWIIFSIREFCLILSKENNTNTAKTTTTIAV